MSAAETKDLRLGRINPHLEPVDGMPGATPSSDAELTGEVPERPNRESHDGNEGDQQQPRGIQYVRHCDS